MHIYIYTYCETSILAPSARKHARKMQPVAAQSALYRRQNAYTMDHGPTIKATNLEAHFGLVAPFLGPESGPCFGATKHKQELFNTGSKCATAAASWQQHISVILYIHININIHIHIHTHMHIHIHIHIHTHTHTYIHTYIHIYTHIYIYIYTYIYI